MSVLEGKVAIVTGTSRGVGVGIAHELLRAGATVIGCSRSPLDALPGIEADWVARASQKVCDQGDYRAIDAFVADVVATYGRIDILVNNAGGTVPAPHVESIPSSCKASRAHPPSDDDYERTVLFHAFAVQMNLISPLWFAIRAYRQMRTRTASVRSSTSPAARVTPPDRRRWSPTARRSPGSTTSPDRWPRSGGRRAASTASRSARR